MSERYRLVVKNGDYGYNSETKTYGDVDYVLETGNVGEALREFLGHIEVENYAGGSKVSLVFKFSKDKKDKKDNN